MTQWRSTCCNPFQKPGHAAKKKSLRPVSRGMCEEYPQLGLSVESRICDNCRKQLAKTVTNQDVSSSSCTSSIPSPQPVEFSEVERIESLQLVSKCLEDMGETPITKQKVRTKKYTRKKMTRIAAIMDKAIIGEEQTGDDKEIVQQLKEKFRSTTEQPQHSVKVQVLTVLPMSWSIEKTQAEFGASNYLVRKAKQLIKDKGILSTPDLRISHTLARRTVDLVSFYESDSSSRMMPRKKDFVSVKGENGRVHIQKRLILSNLKELYQDFKQKHPTECIGFSKFAELRPKHCILAGATGTHSVCVCTIHQNVKLMLNSVNLRELTLGTDTLLTSYHDCLSKTMCNPPFSKCYLGKCIMCPGIGPLQECLVELLDKSLIM